MICRRCGSDVAPTKFCSKCGVLLNGKRCNTCGAIMGVNESFCAECGTPTPSSAYSQGSGNNAGRPNQASAPAVAATPQPQLATSLKKRPRHQAQPIGNKNTRLRGLLGGLGGLAALAVMVYFYLIGDLLMLNNSGTAVAFSPLLFSSETFTYSLNPGSFALYENFQTVLDYFWAFGSMEFNEATLSAVLVSLPGLLFQLAYFIGALLLVIAVLIAVFKFLICLIGGKEFDLMFPVELGLTGFVSMYLALLLMGGGDIIVYNSGLMYGIYAGAAAIALQILLNVGLAGKRFFKTGAVMKWVTNLGFLAGALIMLTNMPISLNAELSTLASPVNVFGISSAALVNGGEITDWAMYSYYAAMAALQIGFVWSLAANAAKAGKRAARTFKFDGYADKGCVFKGLRWAVAAIGFAVLAYLAVDEISTTVILFAVGGILMFVCALLNRIVLNRDQLG